MAATTLTQKLVAQALKQSWFRVKLSLRANVVNWGGKEHPWAILQDVIDSTFALFDAPTTLKVLFHLPGKAITYRFRQDEHFDVAMLFFRCRQDHVAQWLDAFGSFLAPIPGRIPARWVDGTNSVGTSPLVRSIYGARVPRTRCLTLTREPTQGEIAHIMETFRTCGLHNECFSLEAVGRAEQRTLAKLSEEWGEILPSVELCLDFLTPFSARFAHVKGMAASHLCERAFIETFCKRFRTLFGTRIDLAGTEEYPFRIISCYWKSRHIVHHTPSYHQARMEIAGYSGRLYIKGDTAAIFPLLLLLSELHAGASLSCGSGYFNLHIAPVPFFDDRLITDTLYRVTLRDILAGNEQARAAFVTGEGVCLDEQDFVRRIIWEIQEGCYAPQPSRAIEIAGNKGKRRVIETLPLRESLVHTVLLRILHRVIELSLHNCVIGFRPGMSRELAIETVRLARLQGFTWVVESDIADFFPSISHDVLKARLEKVLPVADTKTLGIIMKCVTAPFTINGETHPRKKGLMQGSPLSPLLANLYCIPLDEEMKNDNTRRYVRYGDDFLVFTRTRQQADQNLRRAEAVVAALSLSLKAERTAIKPLGDGVEFLGFRFDDGKKRDETPVNPFRKTLFVAQPFLFLGVNGEAIEISGNKTVQAVVPLRRLRDVVLLEPVSMSTDFLKRCARSGVGVSIALGGGYSVTSLAPDSRKMYDRLQRHYNRMATVSEAEMVCAACQAITAKLHNYSRLFESHHAHGNGRILGELRKSVTRLDAAGSIDQIRGIEGAAARLCFEGLNNCIRNVQFHIKRRDRNIGDRINGLLNFGYYLLFSRLNCLLRANGLNPYLGILHSPENRYESLVCDLQEPFRPYVDKVIIHAINNGVVQENDFVPSARGLYLVPEKRRAFLLLYQREFERQPRNGGLSVHDAITGQVATLRRWVDEEASLAFYMGK